MKPLTFVAHLGNTCMNKPINNENGIEKTSPVKHGKILGHPRKYVFKSIQKCLSPFETRQIIPSLNTTEKQLICKTVYLHFDKKI